MADDDVEVEPMLMGPSGYGTQVLRAPADSPQPFTLYVFGPDLDLPFISGVGDREHALTGAQIVRDAGLRPFLRSIRAEPPLPPFLQEEVLMALKVAARAKRPGVVSMQKDMGMEDASPDVFVETWADAVKSDSDAARTFTNFAIMASLEMTYQDDPERALREMVNIPTLNRREKAQMKDQLAEFLHYKNLPKKLEKELDRQGRRGLFRRR